MTDIKAKIQPIQGAGRVFTGFRPVRSDVPLNSIFREIVATGLGHPRFAAAREPTRDGRVFQALDGTKYYRIEMRIADREGTFGGPDIRFFKDTDGNISLHIELEQHFPAGVPETTTALGQINGTPHITWNGGSVPLGSPTLYRDEESGHWRLRFLKELNADEERGLFDAMTKGDLRAQLQLDFSFTYIVSNAQTPQPPPIGRPQIPPVVRPRPPQFERPRPPRFEGNVGLFPGERQREGVTNFVRVGRRTPAIEAGEPETIRMVMARPPTAHAGRFDQISLDQANKRVIVDNGFRLDPKIIDSIRRRPPVDFTPPPPPASERSKTVTFRRSVPFFFDRNLNQHAHIFAAIVNDGSVLDTVWKDTEFGAIRSAGFPNTVYMLPHEFRLSYDAVRGLPHMAPVQYEADDGTFRLRVTLRAEPWYDPLKVARLRNALAHQSSGAFLHPTVIPGGVNSATLELQTAFPEAIEMLGATGPVEVDPRTPFDLILDLSQEFYQLMASMMTGPVGLNGVIRVVLERVSDTGDGENESEESQTRSIPLRLNFNALGMLPLTIGPVQANINPDSLTLTNNCAQPIEVTGTEITLLQLDENSVSPVNLFTAGLSASLPLSLSAGSTELLSFAPAIEGDTLVWNAVDLAITGTEITLDPNSALRAIHDLAQTAAFGWKLTVKTFQFQIDQSSLPPEEKLVAIEVQMWREGTPDKIVQVTLDEATPETEVTFPRDLNDLIETDTAVEFLRLKLRTRGVLITGFGDWSAERDHTGATMIVFAPVPQE